MTERKNGMPVLCQMAFVVQDIQKSMQQYTDIFGAGPWSFFDKVPVRDHLYRGKPAPLNANLAVTYAGDMQIELIQQTDDLPSVYLEIVNAHGYGLHHCGVVTRNFDADLARYKALGHEVAGSAVTIFDTRAVYLASPDLPHMIELVETNPPFEAAFDEMRRTSMTWDGSQPVRAVDLSAWNSTE